MRIPIGNVGSRERPEFPERITYPTRLEMKGVTLWSRQSTYYLNKDLHFKETSSFELGLGGNKSLFQEASFLKEEKREPKYSFDTFFVFSRLESIAKKCIYENPYWQGQEKGQSFQKELHILWK